MHLPRLRITRVLLVFALTLMITGGAAFAGGGPVISEAMARFHLDFVRNHPVECQAQDGTYLEDVIHYRGTQDSSTPALNGKAKAVVHSLVNIFTGLGVGFAQITIRDPVSGKVTSEGVFAG